MLTITHAEASANILATIAEGRLVQGRWHARGNDGREIACLLGAIHPNVTAASDCDGALMPLWLAELTPALFDGLPAENVVLIARRYGELVGRWHMLSQEQWNAVLNRFLIRVIDDAVEAARPVATDKDYWPAVEKACAQCIAALKSDGDLEAARAAAEAAAWAAARAAEAAWAAWAARAARAAEAYLNLFTFLLDQIELELI